MPTELEHANVTVADAKATAKWMCEVFGWRIRWQGDSIYDGYSVHVGSEKSYIALYNPPQAPGEGGNNYTHRNGLNHLAVVVDDLDATEDRVKAQGFVTGSHADYEPGRRFYFDDDNGVEFEVVSYTS